MVTGCTVLMLPSQILLSRIIFTPREECALGLFFSANSSVKARCSWNFDCKSVLEGELTRRTKDDPSKALRFKYYRMITNSIRSQ